MDKKRATDETLGLIHTLLAQQMLDKLTSEKPLSSQELNAISKFLKDNEITASIEEGTPHARLKEAFSGLDANALGIFNQAAEE